MSVAHHALLYPNKAESQWLEGGLAGCAAACGQTSPGEGRGTGRGQLTHSSPKLYSLGIWNDLKAVLLEERCRTRGCACVCVCVCVWCVCVVCACTHPADLVLEVASFVADAVLVVTAVEELHLSNDVLPFLRRRSQVREGGRE